LDQNDHAEVNLRTSEVPVICVVDDDLSVVEAVVSLLESVGYAAVGFQSAEDFLNSPELGGTVCLILDVRMPGMGGLELQSRLAAVADHTPIIFISAHGDINLSAQTLRRGAVAFLRKPFSQESLLEAVRSVLAKGSGT
jgi:FixJ family two-component response regulator